MSTVPSAENDAGRTARSAENVLRVLIMLRDRESLRVSEIAVTLDVSRSTVHRLLGVLSSFGFVERDVKNRRYIKGPVLAELGLSSLRQSSLTETLRPFLQELGEMVEETVHTVVLEGRNCRFIDSIECLNSLRTTARVGVVYPAHTTSGGKALLAELSQDRLRELFPRSRLLKLNDSSISTRRELFDELDRIREDGYAVNRGESELGIVAVSMAQRTLNGAAPAALAVSAPEQRMPPERLPELVSALRSVTDRARSRLP